jgi:hypothetical protein
MPFGFWGAMSVKKWGLKIRAEFAGCGHVVPGIRKKNCKLKFGTIKKDPNGGRVNAK